MIISPFWFTKKSPLIILKAGKQFCGASMGGKQMTQFVTSNALDDAQTGTVQASLDLMNCYVVY
jgi:hypothetical protein